MQSDESAFQPYPQEEIEFLQKLADIKIHLGGELWSSPTREWQKNLLIISTITFGLARSVLKPESLHPFGLELLRVDYLFWALLVVAGYFAVAFFIAARDDQRVSNARLAYYGEETNKLFNPLLAKLNDRIKKNNELRSELTRLYEELAQLHEEWKGKVEEFHGQIQEKQRAIDKVNVFDAIPLRHERDGLREREAKAHEIHERETRRIGTRIDEILELVTDSTQEKETERIKSMNQMLQEAISSRKFRVYVEVWAPVGFAFLAMLADVWRLLPHHSPPSGQFFFF